MKKHFLLALGLVMALGAQAASEVYTVYNPTDHTLTYFYDDKKSSREGFIESYDPGNVPEDRFMGYAQNVEKAILDASMRDAELNSTLDMFCGYKYPLVNMKDIEHLDYLNTSNVTSMSGMFKGCRSLTVLDLTSFDIRKVETILYMFDGCKELTTIYCNTNWLAHMKLKNAGSDWWHYYHGIVLDDYADSHLFTGCDKLKGGKGTTLPKNHANYAYGEYMRPDGFDDDDNEAPGLFTSKKEVYTRYKNGQLSYFYNKYRHAYEREGYIVELYTPKDLSYIRFKDYHEDVTSAVIAPDMADAKLTSMYCMFTGRNCDLENLEAIDGLHYLNTENVTNFRSMFHGCKSLTSVDLSNFKTDKAISMASMFYNCQKLKTIDLRTFNTNNVLAMHFMFKDCSELTTIYSSEDWSNMENLKDKENMIAGCTKLKGDRGTQRDGTNNIENEYARPDGLKGQPGYFTDPREVYTAFDAKTGTLTYYYDAFAERHKEAGETVEKYEPLTKRFTKYAPQVTVAVIDKSMEEIAMPSMAGLFYGMEGGNLSKLIRIEGLEHLNTSKVTDMRYMFAQCSNLYSLNINPLRMDNVQYINGMFEGCANLQVLACNDDWTKLTNLNNNSLFDGCKKLQGSNGTEYDEDHLNLAYARPDGGLGKPGYFSAAKEVYTIYKDGVLMYCYDAYRTTAKGIVELYDPKNLRFQSYYKDVKKAIILPSMKDAPLTTTARMFYGGWNIDKQQDINLANMTSIEGLQYLNTSNVEDMEYMFSECTNLESIDLSHFNTAKVTSMFAMFSGCEKLTTLDLSTFNFDEVGDIQWMFSYCKNLTTIYCSQDLSDITYSGATFRSSTKLKGNNGTKFNEEIDDATYARPDGLDGKPGYFTRGKEVYTAYKDGTLTYYYDSQRDFRAADGYIVELFNPKKIRFREYHNDVAKGVIDRSMRDAELTTMWCMFYGGSNDDVGIIGLENMTSIEGLEYLNTTFVESMSWMFGHCKSLKSIDLSRFNTVNVKYMNHMFYGCEALATLDVSHFNVANVTNAGSMFSKCENLTTIYCNKEWNINGNTDNMFNGCQKLKGYKGTAYDANHVDAEYARPDGFDGQPGYFTTQKEIYTIWDESTSTLIYTYDAARQYESRPTEVYDIYADTRFVGYADQVKTIQIEKNMAEAELNSTAYMFVGWEEESWLPLKNATKIKGLYYLNTEHVWDMSGMFAGLESVSGFDTYNLRTDNVEDMHSMFNGCKSLKYIDLRVFNTSDVEDMSSMFEGCESLEKIYSQFDWTTYAPNTWNMFAGCTQLKGGKGTVCTGERDRDYDEYAHPDGLRGKAGYFISLIEVYTVATVEKDNLVVLTYYCDDQRGGRDGVVKEVYDHENPTAPRFVGYNEYINVIVIDERMRIANLQTMNRLFFGGAGNALKNVTTIYGLENLDTKYVTDMSLMFGGLASIKELDLTSFNTAKVKDMSYMFQGCTKLATIAANDWSSVANAKNMFDGCVSLVGPLGTAYDESNPKDATYAHSDGGSINPGYFYGAPEVYAELDASTGTLTYYYDSKRAQRAGATAVYKPNDENWLGSIPLEATSIVIDQSIWGWTPTTTKNLFCNLANATTITDLDYLDTREVEDMTQMFFNCLSLQSIDVSRFDTKKVKLMVSMFEECLDLQVLNLYSFDISSLEECYYMFYGCQSLETIYCNEDWYSHSKLSYSGDMFKGCNKLKGGMGTACASYTSKDKTYARPDGMTNTTLGYFTSVPEIYTVYTAADHSLTYYFDGKRNGREGIVERYPYYTPQIPTKSNNSPVRKQKKDDVIVIEAPTIVVFQAWKPEPRFEGYAKDVTTIYLHTSMQNANPYSLRDFFHGISENMYGDNSLSNVTAIYDLSRLNTANVENMSSMFEGLASITSLDLRYFKTDNVWDMDYMFYGCENLETITCSKDWGKSENLAWSSDMFYGCKKLKGSAGSMVVAGHEDGTYARPDGGYTFPGYFTAYYKVTLKAEHGSIIVSNPDIDLKKVPSGTYLSFRAEPEPQYMFDSWTGYDPSVGLIVTGNAEITANFVPVTFTVSFYNWEGELIETQKVAYGQDAVAPEAESITGYNFVGWDADFTKVIRDLKVYAVYQVKTYTVRFYGWDDELLSTQTVNYGDAAVAPDAPTHKGYTFIGWDAEFEEVKTNLDIHAKWKKNGDEGIEEVQRDDVPCTKVLRDGQLFIQRGDKVYTAAGQEVI